jgi:hypothetical protein
MTKRIGRATTTVTAATPTRAPSPTHLSAFIEALGYCHGGRRPLNLEEAASTTRTGDLWLFRGHTVADRTIQMATNSPINHVAVALVIEDLPPLLWHAELGRRLVDVWALKHQRGAQLHRLDDAVRRWHDDFGQRVWMRELTPALDDESSATVLDVVEKMNGTDFPSTTGLAWRWMQGRVRHRSSLELAYCAEIVAESLIEAGVLSAQRPTNWYDPGRFWSGDSLPHADQCSYGAEIEVMVGDDGPPSSRASLLRRRFFERAA